MKKEKDNLKVAVRHFSKRIDRELLSIKEEGSTFIEDMERNIIHIRKLIEDHSELFVRIEEVFGEDYKEFVDLKRKILCCIVLLVIL